MSYNLHLKASVNAKLCLANGSETTKEIVEYFCLYQTPTAVTENCLELSDPLTGYSEWLKETYPEETVTYGNYESEFWGNELYELYEEEEYKENTDESSIPWDDLEKVVDESFRVIHEKKLMEWLKDHEGWDIEWYGM